MTPKASDAQLRALQVPVSQLAFVDLFTVPDTAQGLLFFLSSRSAKWTAFELLERTRGHKGWIGSPSMPMLENFPVGSALRRAPPPHRSSRCGVGIRDLIAFEDGLQLELGSGRHVGCHFDGEVEGEIRGLGNEEFVRTFGHAQPGYAAFVGDSSVWMHHHTSPAERSVTFFVDCLDRHHVIGLANDSDSKAGRTFIMRRAGIESRTPDAPSVEPFVRRGLKFNLGRIQTRARPAFFRQRRSA